MATAKIMTLSLLLAAFGIVPTSGASISEHTEFPTSQIDQKDLRTEENYDPKIADVDIREDVENATASFLEGFQQFRQSRGFRKMAKYVEKHFNSKFLDDMDQLDLTHTTSDEPQRVKRSIRRNRIPRRFRHLCLRNVCPYSSCFSFDRRWRHVCFSCKLHVCHGSSQGPLKDKK